LRRVGGHQTYFQTVTVDPSDNNSISAVNGWGADNWDIESVSNNLVLLKHTGNNLYVDFLNDTSSRFRVNGNNHMSDSNFYTDVKWPSIVSGGNNKVLMDSENYVYILDEFSYRILKSTTPLDPNY